MNYRIEGRNLEMICVELHDSHDTIIAQAGRMIYKSLGVSWEMTVAGQGLVGKLTGSLKRRMSGETATQCLFSGSGGVGFGGTVPGTIQAVEIAAGQLIIAQRGGFLAAPPTVGIGIATARAGVGILGGENIVLQKLTGLDTVFLHAAGDCVEFDLGSEEEVSAELGSMIYHDSIVDYTVKRGGWNRNCLPGWGRHRSRTLRRAAVRVARK